MLIKEYRIPLPLTVEEYRIAQLYMIAKKSRQESKGADSGSGVEILVNEPYENGPGGNGQFTHKVYHVGSHLPGWFKNLLPKSALTVEEKAWNAYPYTKTQFSCPFVEKFSLEIETYYTPDGGHLENVFKLSDSELRNRTVDLIDVVRDQDPHYVVEEDATKFISEKTGRGPLGDNWLQEYSDDCVGKEMPTPAGKAIMCAYKLCKVEFRYWGMQTKIERFIHDSALRNTMLRAHKQAWVWQDEWFGLTMEDIRNIEAETARQLAKTMRGDLDDEDEEEGAEDEDNEEAEDEPAEAVEAVEDSSMWETQQPPAIAHNNNQEISEEVGAQETATGHKNNEPPRRGRNSREEAYHHHHHRQADDVRSCHSASGMSRVASGGSLGSTNLIKSPSKMKMSTDRLSRFSLSEPSPIESIMRSSDDGDSDDEFYDCREHPEDLRSLQRWNSLELVPESDGETAGDRSSAPTQLNTHSDHYQELRRTMSSHTAKPSSDDRWTRSDAKPTRTASTGGRSGGRGKHPTLELEDIRERDISVERSCSTTILILVVHGGSVLDPATELAVRKSDVTTLRGSFESIMRQHYPAMVGRVVIKCVPCPSVCAETLGLLHSLSPYSFQNNNGLVGLGGGGMNTDQIPIGAIPLLVTASPRYAECVQQTIAAANRVYNDFLATEEGSGFSGQVCLIGDSIGSILTYDALCVGSHRSSATGSGGAMRRSGSETSVQDSSGQPTPSWFVGGGGNGCEDAGNPNDMTNGSPPVNPGGGHYPGDSPRIQTEFIGGNSPASSAGGWQHSNHLAGNRLSTPTSRSLSRHVSSVSGASNADGSQSGEGFQFDVAEFFIFGSPIGLLLAYRKVLAAGEHRSGSAAIPRPNCQQVYNLFHPTNPVAGRLEPLLLAHFTPVAPVNLPRYQKYPMGDGQTLSMLELIQANPVLFTSGDTPSSSRTSNPNTPGRRRRPSNESIVSGMFDTQQMQAMAVIKAKWWGTKRVDYAVYCPEGLANFPSSSLPHLFHASFWESTDVISFILRQLIHQNAPSSALEQDLEAKSFVPNQAREKWLKKRTSMKIKNGAANHRGNDVLVVEGKDQVLQGKFSYGPMDLAMLSNEKVDIHIMKEPPSGEWTHLSTELTDKNGRLQYQLSKNDMMGYGVYPVKMVVRGDHTVLDLNLTVVPPKTEAVVFSIDGSFTASVSVTGKDPKVRAGAVDVVRHWQDLGYLIIYITGRPCMQLKKVVAWLSMHNFPCGVVSFADGLSTDPLRHKAEFLKGLQNDHQMLIHAAYGSSKDISVYSALGLKPQNIHIIGKTSKKQQGQCNHIAEGYVSHLGSLTVPGGSRPAEGNARMVIPKTFFGLAGQLGSINRRQTIFRVSSKKYNSLPQTIPASAPPIPSK